MAGKDTDPMIDDFGFESYEPLSLDIDDRKMTPVQKALKGVKTGVKETALTKSTLSSLVRSALPSGMARTYTEVESLVGTGSELYNSLNEQLTPEIERLKRNTRRLMPKVRDKLPNPLAKAIDNLLKDKTQVHSTYEYDPDAETIKGAMRDVFEAQQMVEDYNRAEDVARQLLADKAAERRSDAQLTQLDGIRQSITRLANYQDTVAIRRDQKLLELQYRQYFTQRDLLAETRESNQLILAELNAMVKNTGLPDIAKAREYAKAEKAKGILDRTQDRVDDYINNFRTKITSRLAQEAKQFGSSARMGLMGLNAAAASAGAAAGAGNFGPSWQESAGETVGAELTGSVAELLGQRAGRYLRRVPGVGKLNARLDYYNNNIPELLSDWARQRSNGIRWDFWRKKDPSGLSDITAPRFGADAINFMKDLIPRHRPGTPEFSAQGYGNAREVVSYDELSRKSLVEIIPGLLQRILRSVDGIRTGDANVDKQVYDHSIGQIVSGREMRESVQRQLMPGAASADLNKRVTDLTSKVLRGAKVSAKAREALRKQLLHDMILGRRFNPVNYTTARNLDQVEDHDVARELAAFFAKRFTDGNGELRDGTRAWDKLSKLSTHYNDVRRSIPKFDSTIEQLLDTGNRDTLHELGVLKRDGKRDFLDPNFIANAVLGLGGNDGDRSSPLAGGTDGAKAYRRRYGSRRRRDYVPGDGGNPHSAGVDQRSEGGLSGEALERLIERLERTADSTLTGANSTVERVRNAFRDDANENEQDLAEIVDDVYVRGETEPRLTRAGMRAGLYICKTTKKIIRTLDDIKGPVVDRTGRVILSTADAAAGLATAAGVRISEISERAKNWVDRTGYVSKLIGGRVSNIVDQFSQGVLGLRGRIDDVYVLGQQEPVLTAVKMREGQYVDRHTKKPIKTIDDIKGPVMDLEGNVVLTDEDYEKGMYLKDGTLIRRSGLMYNAGRFTNWYFGGYYRNLWKLMKKGAALSKKMAGSVGRFLIGVPDVYVPGEDSPRLLARMLRRGMYLSSKTGKRIYRLGQIDSDVLGPDGEVVLTLDEARNGLVNKYGEPLRAFLPRALEKAWDIASAPTRLMSKLYGRTMRTAGGLAKRGALAATDALGWGIDKLTGFRKGSWQERRERLDEERRNRKEEKKEKEKKEKTKNPLLMPLMMIAGLLKSGMGMVLNALNPLKYLKDIRLLMKAGSLAGDLLGGVGRKGARGLGRAAKWGGRALATGGRAILASAAGEAVMGAGAAALSGLGTAAAAAGSAALAVLTSPVTLTVAAVAATGFAAWWLWKKFGASPDPIQQVRLSMYGVAKGDRDTNAKVLKLEESMADYTKAYNGGAVFSGRVPMEEVYKLFEIDTSNPQYKQSFDVWFARRFRPVYLRFAAKGNEILSGTKVHEQDDKIPDGDKPRLVRECRFSPDSSDYPYDIPNGPNPPQVAKVGTEEIDQAIEYVSNKFAKAEREKRARDTAAQRKAENAAIASGDKNELKEAASKLNQPDMRYTTDSKLEEVRTDAINAKADVNAALFAAGSSRRIDELAGIRLRTYGLVELDKERTDALLTLEHDMLERVTYDSDGKANIDYVAAKVFETYGPRFQVSPTDWPSRGRWIDWLNNRFMPVMLSFATAVRLIDKSVQPGEAFQKLKPEAQLKVAQAIIGTTVRPWFSKVSVWTIEATPWPGYALNNDSSTTTPAIESLKARVKVQKHDEERKSLPNPNAGTGQEYLTAKDPRSDVDKARAITLNERLDATGTAKLQNLVSGPADANAPGPGGSSVGGDYAAGNATEFTDGTGGEWTTLPDSKGDGWEKNKDLIVAAAKMAGVDPGTMATFAAIESDFRPTVKAGTSSAAGLYQFINSTWAEMLKKYGAKYGIPMNADRGNAKANALMGAEFLKENARALGPVLNRAPTDVDLYAAHFLGAGGAKKLFRLPATAVVADVMPKEAKANASIFYENGGKGRARTRAEVERELARRVNSRGQQYNGAATALAEGIGSGVATIDPQSQSSETTPGDNVVAMPESSAAGGGEDNRVAMDPQSPGGFSKAPASSSSVAPETPTVEPELSPHAQQVVAVPQTQPTTTSTVKAQAPAVEQVTNAELSDVFTKQLQTQIEQRDILTKILNYLVDSKGGDQVKGASNPNDKSTNTQRTLTGTGPQSGNISMARGIPG